MTGRTIMHSNHTGMTRLRCNDPQAPAMVVQHCTPCTLSAILVAQKLSSKLLWTYNTSDPGSVSTFVMARALLLAITNIVPQQFM